MAHMYPSAMGSKVDDGLLGLETEKTSKICPRRRTDRGPIDKHICDSPEHQSKKCSYTLSVLFWTSKQVILRKLSDCDDKRNAIAEWINSVDIAKCVC